MNIAVFGAGYVGLVQAAVLSEVGHHVTCVDIDEQRVADLKQGIIPIYEPGLSTLINKGVQESLLDFTTDAESAIKRADFIFIAVGTPPDEDGSADLRHVLSVADIIGTHMNDEKIIITKSTVPVGTADKVQRTIALRLAKRRNAFNFHVVSNPEFLKEGDAVNDCKRPDRIIIGCEHQKTIDKMKQLYEAFNHNNDRIIVMDNRSAELTKYAANCMLATKISFMNEMANIAEQLGADIEHIRQGIGADTRIGYQFLYPGCGYGGSCFPKDVKALLKSGTDAGLHLDMLRAVEATNLRQKQKLFSLIQREFADEIKGKTFALWGLSFKPNTDDMREAPSRELIDRLLGYGAIIRAYDPEAFNEVSKLYPDAIRDKKLILVDNKIDALENADALVLCTEWKTFWNIDFDLLKQKMKKSCIFDGRNLYNVDEMEANNITYYGIGRGKSVSIFD